MVDELLRAARARAARSRRHRVRRRPGLVHGPAHRVRRRAGARVRRGPAGRRRRHAARDGRGQRRASASSAASMRACTRSITPPTSAAAATGAPCTSRRCARRLRRRDCQATAGSAAAAASRRIAKRSSALRRAARSDRAGALSARARHRARSRCRASQRATRGRRSTRRRCICGTRWLCGSMSAQLDSVTTYRRMARGRSRRVVAIESAVHAHPWTRGNFADSIAAGYHCWVAEREGELVGYGVVMVARGRSASAQPERRAASGSAAASARELTRFFVKLARDHGARTIYLEVRPSNARGARAVRRARFRGDRRAPRLLSRPARAARTRSSWSCKLE